MLAMLDLALRAQIADPITPIAVKTTVLESVRSIDSMASLRRPVTGPMILMGGKLRASSSAVSSLPSCSSSSCSDLWRFSNKAQMEKGNKISKTRTERGNKTTKMKAKRKINKILKQKDSLKQKMITE